MGIVASVLSPTMKEEQVVIGMSKCIRLIAGFMNIVDLNIVVISPCMLEGFLHLSCSTTITTS